MAGEKRKHSATVAELRINSVEKDPSLAVSTFFNGFSAPEDSQFQLYKSKHKSGNYFLHGENETLAFDGKSDEDSEYNSYYVAVYDPVNKAVDLYSAPVVPTKVAPKAKLVYNGPSIRQKDALNVTKRNALGQEFGTKKAKKAIANVSQNRIEAEKLQHNETDIIENIKQTTDQLPTAQEMNDTVSSDRPTPVCNVSATNVEDIYPVHNIIPKKEWSFIHVDSLLKESDTKKRLEFFPYKSSFYISSHLPDIKNANQLDRLKLLYYASLLFGMFEHRRSNNKLALMEKLNDPSEILIDGILDRFTTVRTSQFGRSKDKSFTVDPYHEDKLLCYLLATILHIDNFIVRIPPLAQELSMKPSKLASLFRALGCTVKPATVAQAEAFGIPKSMAATHKVATLKVPFKEPVMVRRGRR